MNIMNTADTGVYDMDDAFLKAVKKAVESPVVTRKSIATPLPSISDKYRTEHMLNSMAYIKTEPKPELAEKAKKGFPNQLKEMFKRISKI